MPVTRLCEASLRLVRQPANKKRLQVSTQLDPRVRTLNGDNRRLKQLLVNLLSNAVKFTPEGGTIGLEVRGDPARQVAEFTVWDRGIGIAKEHMARLFKPFVQLDSALTRQYSGTGLGLALAFRMAERHGGSIAVESELGQGSRFIVTLPWSGGDASARETETASQSVEDAAGGRKPGSGATILIAEDNKANAAMLAEYLHAKGYQVVAVEDGVEAVAQARALVPDIILMDIQIPNLDGLEATRLIRADDSVRHIPIIAITALTMPGDEEQCVDAGVNAYLSKPVGMRELMQEIERQLGTAESTKP